MRCTPKHLFSPQLGHCSRCPAWSPSCPASRRSCTLRKEAGKVLQSLALSAASKNKSKYPSNNLLEVEGGFAPATNFIASQTVEGFWSWPVHSGEKKSVCAPCYLTLLKGNFSVLGNTLILSSPICDLWISAPALLFSLNICGGVTVQWCPLFFFFNQKKQEVFLTSSWADHVPLYPSPPFGRRQHSVHLYGIPAQPPGSSQGTSWEGKARSGAWASTDIAWFRGIHPSATLTENNRQSPNILIVHSGEKTSEWLQKEKYVWVLIAQHVLCLVSNTAKK